MCDCKHNGVGCGVDGHFCCHEEHVGTLGTLGLVATHNTEIRDGRVYDPLFPKAHLKDQIVNPNGNVKYTLDQMERVVRQYNFQTEKLAKQLKRKTIEETLPLVWTFAHTHLKYKLDKEGVEELRTPARSWHDGQIMYRDPATRDEAGIDCDCFSIFVSSILTNLKIFHKLRVTKYGAGWQHVYVIVPVPNKPRYNWIMDCVLDRFNIEKTYTDKIDYTMNGLGIPVAILSGLDDASELLGITSGADFDQVGFGATEDAEAELGALKKHLVRTRDYIARNPHSVLFQGGAKNNLKMLDHAISNWDGPNRMSALTEAAHAEHKINVAMGLAEPEDFDPNDGMEDPTNLKGFVEEVEDGALQGLGEADLQTMGLVDDTDEFGDATNDQEDDVDGLGRSTAKKQTKQQKKEAKKEQKAEKKAAKKAAPKKFMQNVRKAAGTIAKKTKAAAKSVSATAKKAGKTIAKTAKKAVKAVVKYNPVSLAARGGFLLFLKLGFVGMAAHLRPAYWTQQEASSRGITAANWRASVGSLEQVRKIFVKTLQGSEANLKKAIIEGATKSGLQGGLATLGSLGHPGGLGDPATVTAITAAAVPLTAAAKAIDQELTDQGVQDKAGFLKKVGGFFKNVAHGIASGVKKLKAKHTAKKEAKAAAKKGDKTTDSDGSNAGSGDGSESDGGDGGKEQSGNNPYAKEGSGKGNKGYEAGEGDGSNQEEGGADPLDDLVNAGRKIASSAGAGESEEGGSETGPGDESKEFGEKYDSKNPPAIKNDDSEGFFAKVGNFAKENPGTTTAIVVGATAATLMIIPGTRKAILGVFTKKKSGLSGTGRKRKKRSRRRVVTPSVPYNKRKVKYIKM